MWRTFDTFIFVVILTLVTAGMAVSAEKDSSAKKTSASQRPKITVSKETTRFTKPLREDGSLDCIQLLNEIAGKDVTPENNAAVLFWQAVGPQELSKEHRERYFKLLGMTCPAETGDYLVSVYDYADSLKIKKEDFEPIERLSKQLDAARKKPWSANEFPELADCLRKNEQPFSLIAKASNKPKLFTPLVATNDEFLSSNEFILLSPLLDSVRLLVARSMLNLKKGHEKEAWDDLLACFRLGQLETNGPLLMDLMSGSGIEIFALDGIIALANFKDLKAEQAQKCLAVLARLNTQPSLEKIQTNEWIYFVNFIYDLAVQRHFTLRFLGVNDTKEERTALRKLAEDPKMDWDEVLRLFQKEWELDKTLYDTTSYREVLSKLEKNHKSLQQQKKELSENESFEKLFHEETPPRMKAKAFVILESRDQFGYNKFFPIARRKMDSQWPN